MVDANGLALAEGDIVEIAEEPYLFGEVGTLGGGERAVILNLDYADDTVYVLIVSGDWLAGIERWYDATAVTYVESG